MIVLCFLLGASKFAFASLGDNVSSIEKDRAALKGQAAVIKSQGSYSTHEVTTPSNVITEYISPSGTVFAVRWTGAGSPDATTLLGSYSAEYLDAMNSHVRVPGHRRLAFKSSRLVIHRMGHMRDMHNYIYDPSLVPAGVNAEALP